MSVRMLRLALYIVTLLALLAGLAFLAVRPAVSETNCALDGPEVTDGSDAGGKLVTFVVDCKGNESVKRTVTVTQGGVLLFKADVVKKVSGSLFDREAIHLPPLPPVEQVCVSVEPGPTVCVPPA